MLNKKISVVIPVYNIADYLPRCLESVINQTYSNLEIIVISDGSTDNSNDIIKAFAEKDKRIIPVFKDNSGVSDTRNRGINIATGEYIGFVDGDDYIEPNMYEVLINNAIKYSADISHCGYQMVFPSKIDYYFNTKEIREQNRVTGIFDLLLHNKIEPGVWNKIYKNHIIKGIHFETGIRENEDMLFNVEAFEKSTKSIYEDLPLYHYILRLGSATTGDVKEYHIQGVLDVAEKIFSEFSKDETIAQYIYSYYVNANLNAYKLITYSKKNELKKYYKNVRINLKKLANSNLSLNVKMEKLLINYFPHIYRILISIHHNCTSDKYEIK